MAKVFTEITNETSYFNDGDKLIGFKSQSSAFEEKCWANQLPTEGLTFKSTNTSKAFFIDDCIYHKGSRFVNGEWLTFERGTVVIGTICVDIASKLRKGYCAKVNKYTGHDFRQAIYVDEVSFNPDNFELAFMVNGEALRRCIDKFKTICYGELKYGKAR